VEPEVQERARKYIENLKSVLAKLEATNSCSKVIRLAETYLRDAEYYYSVGDYVTSIACSSYAEGLLDALREINLVEFEWPQSLHKARKVLVGGVFEIIHPGHIHFLREASKLGRVVVIVARDDTVRKLKGREPIVPEKQRLEVVKSIKYVAEAYLGEPGLDIEKTLRRVKPDIVFLGPDQSFLEELLKKHNVPYAKLNQRRETTGSLNSSSAIIERITDLFCKKRKPSRAGDS